MSFTIILSLHPRSTFQYFKASNRAVGRGSETERQRARGRREGRGKERKSKGVGKKECQRQGDSLFHPDARVWPSSASCTGSGCESRSSCDSRRGNTSACRITPPTHPSRPPYPSLSIGTRPAGAPPGGLWKRSTDVSSGKEGGKGGCDRVFRTVGEDRNSSR